LGFGEKMRDFFLQSRFLSEFDGSYDFQGLFWAWAIQKIPQILSILAVFNS
jgi:hypothetical protein